MIHNAQFDHGVFVDTKRDLDNALTIIGARLEQYFEKPADAPALQAARSELQRLFERLKVIPLNGLAAFCAELGAVLDELAPRQDTVSALHRDVLRRAIQGLAHYLDELADGANNAALRLFPQYQELQQLRGIERSFELDLFYPDLAVQLPQQVLDTRDEDDAPSRLKSLRSRYQQNLLHLLRREAVPTALQSMQQVLNGVMHCVPQDDSRAFWWIAAGLLDCVRLDGLPPELNARKLLGRIDQQIRAVIEGDAGEVQLVLNEMLYLIARSHAVSDLVQEIKQVYALDSCLPKPAALPPGEASQILGAMRDLQQMAEESWERCAQGNRAACNKFVEYTGQLVAQSQKLDRNTLQYLTQQIQAFSQYAGEPEHVRPMALDMAMALLLLRGGIRHYGSLGDSFQEQARILSGRMQDVVQQQPENVQRLAELTHLHYRMEQGDVLTHLFNEMLANLQYVEQGLSAFFSDAARRAELAGLLRMLEQMRGGLHLASLDTAGQLLALMLNNISQFAQSGNIPETPEIPALTEAVGVLEDYLQHLANAQAADTAPLLKSLAELSKLQPTSVPTPAAVMVEQAGPPAETQHAGDEDQELLEVFLEEAQEVLHTMRDNLEVCQLHPDSREPLVTIRRGFHTLKGSGRMVGLNDLGEIAWCIERALNKWLQDNKPAVPNLLGFIAEAVRKFTDWVDALNRQGGVSIEADKLIAAAQQIENGSMPDQPASIDSQLLPLASSAVPPEEIVRIGEITLPAALFDIASVEAKQNAAILRRQLDGLRARQNVLVPYDLMRAAHTLASVNRTMGFAAVAELAYTLDSWLQAHIDREAELDAPRLVLLKQAVASLETMVQSICDKQMPQARADLVKQLTDNRDKLGNKPPDRAEKPQIQNDVDEQLLLVFLEEAGELCPMISTGLRLWREQPNDSQQPQLLKRLLHTLKGSARMAGAMHIGEIAHQMEERILSVAQTNPELDLLDELENNFDDISAQLESLRAVQTKDEHVLRRRRADDQAAPGIPGLEYRTPETVAERVLPGNMLRVRSDVIDKLVNEAGEISVARSRMETEMHAFKEGLLELTGSVTRLRKQLREVEIQAESQMQARASLVIDNAERFDPLEFDRFTRLQELVRFMNESVHDVQAVQQALLKNFDETVAAITVQTRLSRELQQNLMGVRMVPFASIGERLYRIVRQTGKELNKRANLELIGTDVELDRSVLERMTAPFEHLLRNALAHGLEDSQTRTQNGKNPIGEIRLALRHENNEVVFEFSDDGAGLNLAALRDKAQAKGLLRANETVSDERLAQLIFVSGVSTAAEVTEVAGRGIGMDVVRSEIAALGGRIDVSSKKGAGAQFFIRLPLTLAVTHILVVRSGDVAYAIPSTMVEQVLQMKSAELAQLYGNRRIEWQNRTYSFHYLPHLLGDTGRIPENLPHNQVLLLRSGDQHIALHVDGLLGNQEAVVKNMGPQLARLPWIAGATVLGNGAATLILNPAQLIQRSATAAPSAVETVPENLHIQPLVMVVDDSLTVRKITTRLLTRAGYQVVTARDGVDALEQLGEISPAVMLLDIEMPRMDGFELAKHLRGDPRTRSIPIIMITSRTADKHRNYAMQLGVNAYLGKPYQEDELLRRIAGFVAAPAID